MNNFYVHNPNDDLQLPEKRYSNLHSIELKNQVIASHEYYLQKDDNDERDEYRKKLHKHVVNYLLKIPHQNKFLLPEFNFIFENCIEKNLHFEPLQAAESFDVLFRIANNLILKPWRKEFHSICIYNSYFKHLISRQIPHYEHILKFMGYEAKNRNGILTYQLVKRKNHQEIWKLISFDCYVAYVEFRFIYQFGDILWNKNIKPNWEYIFRLRKKYTGDFESTLEKYLLIYHDQINEQQQQINRKYKHLSALINQYEKHQADISLKSSNGNLIDLDSLPSVTNNYADLENSLLNSTLNNNYTTSQPTSLNQSSHRYANNYLRHNGDNYYLTKHMTINNLQPTPRETNLDQVDFIDDEGDNDDEGLATNLKNEFNSKIKCLDSNAQKLELAMKSDNDKLSSGRIKSNSLEKKSNKIKSVEKKFSTLDLKSDKKKKALSNKSWICMYCTYQNESKDSICKICSKSMNSKSDSSNELTPMSKECGQCTLVNKKSLTTCSACGNSLKNTPTYI